MTGAADRGIRLKPMGRRARPPGGVRRPLRPREQRVSGRMVEHLKAFPETIQGLGAAIIVMISLSLLQPG